MANETKSLGEKLRELRENYDLSQNQVAQALNIDRSTYTNYELDKTRPSLETLVVLSHILNVPSSSLLPRYSEYLPDEDEAAQPESIVKSLTKKERGLIVLYRALTRDQRNDIVDEMANLAKKNSENRR